MDLSYLYQLQDVSFSYLQNLSAKISVIDMDDSGLTSNQIGQLQGNDQVLLTYLSIGEAEDYRDYWNDGGWSKNSPDFLLGENPDWEGNYLVKFWDQDWQDVIFERVEEAVSLGYNGVYLDIVDAYAVKQVKAAYNGSDIRQEMLDFVIEISDYARSLDPDFMIVPQNAVELLAQSESNSGTPNTAYLDAIDGIGVEDLWYDDNTSASWTRWDLEYIELAQNADKFVLSTSYPTTSAKQESFVDSALAEGFIPFVGTRDLDRDIPNINFDTPDRIGELDFNLSNGDTPEGPVQAPDEGTPEAPAETPDVTPPEEPTETPDEATPENPDAAEQGIKEVGGDGDDTISGTKAADVLKGLDGNDSLNGDSGNDVLKGGQGDDLLKGNSDNDELNGGSGDDRLEGGNDDDLLIGGGGADKLIGGSGDDWFVFDSNDTLLRGGAGFDTLQAANRFDFDLADTAFKSGFEALNLDNGKKNEVQIDSADILNKVDTGTLFVSGDSNDNILSDMGSVRDYSTVDGTSYAVFRSNGAELFVEVGIEMNGELVEWM